ncbi:helix-turn-helix transcriptional regulator [Streptomyces sp. NPDC051555]|uniref:helix-turn-helix transcriptional regulator n=1 Tax=Streptomyces sp. NPDC051555 TaxID=3365657 RepID=UPI0037A43ED7
MEPVKPRTNWTFITNHARILAMILRDPEIRVRDMASACEVTERAAQAIVTDLESAGYLTRVRNGRRNHYAVASGTFFRHPAEHHHEIRSLLKLLVDLEPPDGTATEPDSDYDSGDGPHEPDPHT